MGAGGDGTCTAAAGGRFIVLEGGEGAGKSTQARRLAAFLRAKGLPVVETREPGGTPVGERIREVVLGGGGSGGGDANKAPGDPGHLKMPTATEVFLILAARAAFVQQVVSPALALGKWVVSDRFDLSTFAYQGYGRGVPLEQLERLNRYATGGLQPDLYVVLDLPAQEGLARHARDGKPRDRFESGGGGFLKRVSDGYLSLVQSTQRAVSVSASGNVDQVADQVRQVVEGRFAQVRETSAGRRSNIGNAEA